MIDRKNLSSGISQGCDRYLMTQLERQETGFFRQFLLLNRDVMNKPGF